MGSSVTETDYTPVITSTYNNQNQILSKNNDDGSSTQYTYDNNRLHTEVKTASDGITVTTTYGYNTTGNISSKQVVTSNPSSTWTTTYTYDSNGLLQTETLLSGSRPQIVKNYDYMQNAKVQPGPTSVITQYYDAVGTLWRTTKELSTYDDYGELVSKTVPATYDPQNFIPGSIISYSKTTTSTQKIERVIYASGVYSETVSDCCKPLYSTDIDGKVTYYVYDNIGRQTKTYTNESGQSDSNPLVENTYDGFGRTKTTTTRANANTARTTTYTYDNLNRVVTVDNPGTLADEQAYYDVYGNLMAKSLGGGRSSIYKYDALNRVSDIYNRVALPSPLVYPTTTASVHNIYMYGTNTVMAANTPTLQSRYLYNGLGQLTSVYWPLQSKTITYTYDTMGRKSSVSDGTNTTNYTYNPMGSTETVKLGSSLVADATYSYDNVGNRARVDFGNGTWQTFSYGNDARYLMTGIDYAYKCNSTDTVTNKGGIRLTRSNGGNPLSWADNTDKFIKTFSYDNQGRIANADIPGVSRTDYGYDWVGNRTSPTAVYNDADQLTSYNGNSYAYNTYGDMTSGAGRTYSINTSTGRVSSVMLGTESYEYTYDPYGNRIDVGYDIDGGVADWTVNTYDITAGVPALLDEYHPWGSVDDCYYVREPNGELIMRVNGTDKKYYHFDELGSTLFLTDANGVQTDKYVYNAWGKIVSSSGSTVNPFKYVGRYGYYHDSATGLYWLATRFYDPDADVFTQRDIAKDGLSYYAYTSGNTMVATDPWGKTALPMPPLPVDPNAIPHPVGKGIITLIGIGACMAYPPCREAVLDNIREAWDKLVDIAKELGKLMPRCKTNPFKAHNPHHNFPLSSDGRRPCYREHYQVDCWIPKLSGSQINIRIGVGPCYTGPNRKCSRYDASLPFDVQTGYGTYHTE